VYRYHSATALATLLFALRGTPYVYMGQEIGMTNGDFTGMEDIRDTESFNIDALAKKMRFPEKFRWKMIKATGRDNARTPMQWDNRDNGGFTEGDAPWLRVNKNASYINVEADRGAEESIFEYYKKLIELRKTLPVLIDGDFKRLPAPVDVFMFAREWEGEKVVAICSLAKTERALFKPVSGEVLAGNYIRVGGKDEKDITEEDAREGTEDNRVSKQDGNIIALHTLRPYEAILMKSL
jgi:oligo-1,6-glucosidase